jgi:Mrp family chromosome partitioning ATPase
MAVFDPSRHDPSAEEERDLRHARGRPHNSSNGEDNENEPTATDQRIVRIIKPVVFSEDAPGQFDKKYVNSRFYSAFNYSLLSNRANDPGMSLGITSPNPAEGKTIVASNLAISLALTHQKETVIVDLNIRKPRIHSIFGTKLGPGLVESLNGESVVVFRTSIKHLSVLSAGDLRKGGMDKDRFVQIADSPSRDGGRSEVRLEHVAAFRDVVYSLREVFHYVVIDMPSLTMADSPAMLTSQMDGIFVVVDVRKTKLADLEKMFRRVNEQQVQGFVMNRTPEDIT